MISGSISIALWAHDEQEGNIVYIDDSPCRCKGMNEVQVEVKY
jgi:hypothetical protein